MKKIEVFCKNAGQQVLCTPGTTMAELAKQLKLNPASPYLAAFANHKLKDLAFEIYKPYHIEFVDFSHIDGSRTYIRSLSFLLQKAVHDLYPQRQLILDYSVSNGIYGTLDANASKPCTQQELEAITHRMQRLVAKKIPFLRTRKPIDEAIKIFQLVGKHEKALLLQTRQSFYASVYYLDGYPDSYFGPLAPDTGCIQVFGLIPFHNGFLLQYPDPGEQNRILPKIRQEKLFEVFKEHGKWCRVIGARNIGSINTMIHNGEAPSMIMLSEALHERKYAQMADELYKRREELKLVLIAGPSSSGKTTTSKRLELHAKVVGLQPKVIALDNYFVDREHTPRDTKGDYDYEVLEALDLDFLNQQLLALFRGEEVEIPTFDFAKGKRIFDGQSLRLGEKDLLILEGIHGLNPKLTEAVSMDRKYKVYASALTSVSLDENNRIFTTDNRLLRRIVRDSQHRGTNAEEVILRWPSVRRGENKFIFPFQEQADIMFNSALLYELPVLRYFAEPLLRRIPPSSAAYPEAYRLLKFLNYIEFMHPANFMHIPAVSVLREFIGNSSLVH